MKARGLRRKAARREEGALGLTALCAAVAALATFAGQPGTAAALLSLIHI